MFSLAAYDSDYPRWWYLSLSFGVLVLALQFSLRPLVRAYAIWTGLFVILQTLVSPWFVDRHFVTLLPNLDYVVDVVEGLPGISGPQRVTTDERGFRTTRTVDYQDPSTLRLFAIGASTMEQIFLDDKSTFTHLLQERLARETGLTVEVINTGVSGLRARHHYATLAAVRGLHPDLALVLVGVNDWNRHIRTQFGASEKTDGAMSLPPWQANLKLRNTLMGMMVLSVQLRFESRDHGGEATYRKVYGEYYTMQRNSLGRPKKYRFRPSEVSDDYKAWLDRIINECGEQRISCIFANQPNGYQEGASDSLKASFWMTPPNTSYSLDFDSIVHIAALYNRYLLEHASARGMAVCNIAAQIAPSLENFYDDVHFNTLGAQRVADALFPCVLDQVKRLGLVGR